MPTVTAEAPAKVNLWLSVGPLGDDGYHSLVTVFQALTLCDEVTASSSPNGAGITIAVEGEGAADVPLGPDNLVWRAAHLLAEALDVEPDVHLRVVKRIPVAGGMAGGSADAAATLMACDALWEGWLGKERLGALGAALGSDVPFALHGGIAIGTDHGDRLSPALARGEFHWAIALADGGLSTPRVYRELDRLRVDQEVSDPAVSEAVMVALRDGDAPQLGRALGNDLQAAALSLRPSLGRLLELGVDEGALGGMVSGSGPTCAFLARDRDHALDLAARISGSGLVRSVACASGPAPGARVVSS